MTKPYSPSGGLLTRLNRQSARFFGRRPINAQTDHAIVTFTFDDFPKTAARMGAQTLERRGWRGTYYASARYAGGETHHGAMFDMGDLQRLQTQGHEIGCHTYGHVDCARASLEEVIADVERNARALTAMGLDQPLENFAFPYGEASPAIKTALQGRFASLRGVRADINRAGSDLNLLRSVPLDGGETGIRRAIEATETLSNHPGWLIFYAHDIQEQPTEWGCTPAQFEAVCAAVEASGARVLPMRDALRALEGQEC